MALTLAEAAATALARAGSAGVRRAGRSVRRDSLEAGTFEHRFFVAPGKGDPDRMLRAARLALDLGRRLKRAERAGLRVLTTHERALAGITAGAVRVFEEICALARLNSGRVFPTYDRLARATALARATIARAVAALEAAGLLARQRRFKRVNGEGSRYAQTSNAYRPMLPRALADATLSGIPPVPPPADAIQREADRIEELRWMETRSPAWKTAHSAADGLLEQALARLGAAIDRTGRESQKRSEPLHTIICQSIAEETGSETLRVPPSLTKERRLNRRILPWMDDRKETNLHTDGPNESTSTRMHENGLDRRVVDDRE